MGSLGILESFSLAAELFGCLGGNLGDGAGSSFNSSGVTILAVKGDGGSFIFSCTKRKASENISRCTASE